MIGKLNLRRKELILYQNSLALPLLLFIKWSSLALQPILLYWRSWDYFIITLGKKYKRNDTCNDLLKLQPFFSNDHGKTVVPIFFLFLFFRVDMLKQVSWQPSKLWMSLR